MSAVNRGATRAAKQSRPGTERQRGVEWRRGQWARMGVVVVVVVMVVENNFFVSSCLRPEGRSVSPLVCTRLAWR